MKTSLPWLKLVGGTLALALLGLGFMAYLRPEFMVDVANQIFVLCGW
jgi:hypothetical protein